MYSNHSLAVERYHQYLKDQILCRLKSRDPSLLSWPEAVRSCNTAYITNWTSKNNESPYYITYGQDALSGRELDEAGIRSLSEDIPESLRQMEEIKRAAEQYRIAAFQKRLERDGRVWKEDSKGFLPGDVVWWIPRKETLGKFDRTWGPYRVRERTEKGTCVLHKIGSNYENETRAHIRDLKHVCAEAVDI